MGAAWIYAGTLMNDLAIKLIKEAVLRVLVKNPQDFSFYQEQADDLLLQPAYRESLRQAVEEWRELQK